MRIAIVLIGSRGDVQPGVALGLELQRRGHSVTVSIPNNLIHLAQKNGLETVSYEFDFSSFAENNPDINKALAEGGDRGLFSKFSVIKKTLNYFKQTVNEAVPKIVEICKDADLIIATQTSQGLCASIAQKLSVPLVAVHVHPLLPNSYFAAPLLTVNSNASKFVVRSTWVAYDLFQHFFFGQVLYKKAIKKSLGIKRFSPSPAPRICTKHTDLELQAYFAELIPGIAEELGPQRPFTGPFRLPAVARSGVGESLEEDPGLTQWLEAGDPPVFLAFGSFLMTMTQEEIHTLAHDVSRHLGERVLVNMGKTPEYPEISDQVRLVGPIAHDYIFPRCSAALVHGGVGTLHEALLAGIPVLVCWVSFDQPVWGSMIEKAGLGSSVQLSQLSNFELLKSKMKTLVDPQVKANARAFGENARAQQSGIVAAADLIEQRFPASP